MATATRIDIHSHVLPTEIMGKAGQYGPDFFVDADGMPRLKFWHLDQALPYQGFPFDGTLAEKTAASEDYIRRTSDPKVRLAEMDDKGIDIMGVTASPIFYLYAGDRDVAVSFARTQNDALANYCQADPERLFFMPTLPLADMDASLEEFDRAVANGGRAINIACHNIAGNDLDEEYFFPLWEKCQAADLPIMLHPEPMLFFKDSQPWNPARMLLDYVYQDTLAPLSMVTGGVFDAFPRLKIYVTHGGGFLPYQWGRFEIFAALDKRAKQQKPLNEYLDNIYVDILVHDLRARQMLVDWIGVDHVVMGDNYEGQDSADGFAFVEELDLSDEDKRKIMADNAIALFKL